MKKSFDELKKSSNKQRTTSAKERIQILKMLDQGLIEFESQICSAIFNDFGKSKTECLLTEIYPLRQEIKSTIKNLKFWMQDIPVESPLAMKLSQSWIHTEAKGICLIISPWNYPFQLAIAPLIPALAAGNTCIIKPSEISNHTAKIISQMIDKVLPNHLCRVIEGDQNTTSELLKLPFDHIFFTGSTQVGKIIMQEASQTLASVTLELGGKSPALVTENTPIAIAAEKIIWGKLINSGQTCVAPDYVIVHESKYDTLVLELKKQILRMEDKKQQTQIINDRHFQRLIQLAQNAKEVHQSLTELSYDAQKRFINLQLYNCGHLRHFDDRMMTEEIFGPLLPLVTYSNKEQIVKYFQQQPRPLAFYLFSSEQSEQKYYINQISCGGMSINDCLVQVGHHSLPFGGIGHSGMGSYHGYAGFLTFSHQKSIFKQGLTGQLIKLFYPPYNAKIEKLVQLMTRFNL